MGNQPVNQTAEQQTVAGPADNVAAPPAAGESPDAEELQRLYNQAMEDNSILAQNLGHVQTYAQQLAQQQQAVLAQQALGQHQNQENAFLESIQDLPAEEQKRQIRQFYGAQTAQVMQMAQGLVQQSAAEKWQERLVSQYGLNDEERRILAGTHPSQMENVAQQLYQRNQQFQQIQGQIQNLTASQVAQQMQNSGAYAGGGGNQAPMGGGAEQPQYERGKRSHLQYLLRNPQQ